MLAVAWESIEPGCWPVERQKEEADGREEQRHRGSDTSSPEAISSQSAKGSWWLQGTRSPSDAISRVIEWTVDNGASRHMTGRANILTDLSLLAKRLPVDIPNGDLVLRVIHKQSELSMKL
ncbi:uncharacterized protein LOC116214961 [Punica granatum]|uniref:Uncharacterized protein LOC116214961 n=1 Tax=Punica granatum TaxID=22663 RepID=A0A6P8EKS1_PUNGR|nr:uncharacterized protein LOC116214961 [Punica granatum]